MDSLVKPSCHAHTREQPKHNAAAIGRLRTRLSQRGMRLVGQHKVYSEFLGVLFAL